MNNEMPNVMYIDTEQREFAFLEGDEFLDNWNVEKYYHSRVVEDLLA